VLRVEHLLARTARAVHRRRVVGLLSAARYVIEVLVVHAPVAAELRLKAVGLRSTAAVDVLSPRVDRASTANLVGRVIGHRISATGDGVASGVHFISTAEVCIVEHR